MKTSQIARSISASTDLARHAICCGLAALSPTVSDMDALESDDGLTIETKAGPAHMHFYPAKRIDGTRRFLPPWLHIRFLDVERAKACIFVSGARLNPYSGKYNFMDLDAQRAMGCETELRLLVA